jgi:hypothetical protein
LQSQVIYWQNYPIESSPEATQRYLSVLQKCKTAAEALYRNEAYKHEATFYLLSAHGSISRVYHHRKDYLKAAIEARNAYSYLKDGFELTSKIPDFLFMSGLYNFYRVQYPETHPQIKPAIYFFRNGNKTTGLNHLREAGNKALFTGVEARYFLAGICLKYENRNAEALSILKTLHQEFPENPLFTMRLTEALLVSGETEKAKLMNSKLAAVPYTDHKMAYWVFKGMIEFKEGKLNEARNSLEKSLQSKSEGNFTKDLKPMAELTLAKVWMNLGEKSKASVFVNKAVDNSEYAWVSKEAKSLKQKL